MQTAEYATVKKGDHGLLYPDAGGDMINNDCMYTIEWMSLLCVINKSIDNS
jgi:hypothetical protein